MTQSDEIRNRYWEVSDRLADARLKGSPRVEMLTYGAEMLAREYRTAKAQEPNALQAALDDMFRSFGFPAIRK